MLCRQVNSYWRFGGTAASQLLTGWRSVTTPHDLNRESLWTVSLSQRTITNTPHFIVHSLQRPRSHRPLWKLMFITACAKALQWTLFWTTSMQSSSLFWTTWMQSSSHIILVNPLNAELNPICCLLALLRAHHFLHVSRIRVKLLTLRRLTSYIYGAPILDVSRSHTTTQHIR